MTPRIPSSLARVHFAVLAVALLTLLAVPAHQALSRSPPTPLPQPTEAETGVPLYPGAKYDGMNSAGMSQNETYHWLFLTTDPVEKVVAFYKEKIKVPPLESSGSYVFALKGNKLIPDYGVTVEPNRMFPGPAKTVITIAKPKQ